MKMKNKKTTMQKQTPLPGIEPEPPPSLLEVTYRYATEAIDQKEEGKGTNHI